MSEVVSHLQLWSILIRVRWLSLHTKITSTQIVCRWTYGLQCLSSQRTTPPVYRRLKSYCWQWRRKGHVFGSRWPRKMWHTHNPSIAILRTNSCINHERIDTVDTYTVSNKKVSNYSASVLLAMQNAVIARRILSVCLSVGPHVTVMWYCGIV